MQGDFPKPPFTRTHFPEAGKPLGTLLEMRTRRWWLVLSKSVGGEGRDVPRWYATDYETRTTRPFRSLTDHGLCVVFAAYRAASKILKPLPVLTPSLGR